MTDSPTLTDAEVQALKDADEARTKGEWMVGANELSDQLYTKGLRHSIACAAPHNLAFIALAANLVPRLLAEREEMKARVARLEAALEPFVPRVPTTSHNHPSATARWFRALTSLPDDKTFAWAKGDLYEWRITMGDLRAAYAALSASKPEPPLGSLGTPCDADIDFSGDHQ